MSRHYEMRISVKEFNKDKLTDITLAIENEWNITDQYDNGDGEEVFAGEGNLAGGEGEEAFARRVGRAIWEANEAYCVVEVAAVYLDDPPTEYHIFDEEDYAKWKAAQCPVPPTTS